MGLSPLDVVLQIIPGLKPEDKLKVKAALGCSACEREGHKLKHVKVPPKNWRDSERIVIYCERCDYKKDA